jgi:predicted nucleic acid-binding Zn ribbon protein
MSASDEPTTLGDSLHGVVASLRTTTPGASSRAVGGLFRGWAGAVGPNVAAHARPVVLDGGRLLVEVDEPGWATQLRFLESDLLARVAPLVAPDVVERLEVRVAGGRTGSRNSGGSGRRNPTS